MNPRVIRALPESVINQIAAGEVIERPASIVKELIENALDAGAGSIEIEIHEGGVARILVRDDGSGIARDELPLALTRHCTSKITSAHDLSVLVTLGFRGEALAAIAAVADTTLISRNAEAVHGWRIAQRPGAAAGAAQPVPHPRGTTVTVCDLFARVPARREFLKRAQTEALHVVNLVRRVAFCTPGVAFSLAIDGEPSLQVPAASDARSAERRQRALFGAEFAAAARYVDHVLGDIRVAGWVAEPALTHAQADLQMLAVNGRTIRDRHVLHAVRVAYDARLPVGRHACFALHLELPPDAVDVNVHPGKLEVRFRDLRAVHDVVHASVRQALDAPVAGQYALPWSSALPHAAHDAPRTALHPLAPASSGPASPPQEARAAAAVLRVIDDRYVLLEEAAELSVIDLVPLAEAMLAHRLVAGCAIRPLLIPLRLECRDADTALRFAAALSALGLENSPLGERTLALRALPVPLPGVDAARFGAALIAAGPPRVLADLAGVAARSLQVPPASEQGTWLARFLKGAREAGLDPAQGTRVLDSTALARLFASRT